MENVIRDIRVMLGRQLCSKQKRAVGPCWRASKGSGRDFFSNRKLTEHLMPLNILRDLIQLVKNLFNSMIRK